MGSLTAQIKKTNRYHKKINNLLKKVKESQENKIYIGYFNDQGLHLESKLRYVDLMTIHEFGAPLANIPPRPILNLTQEGGEFSSLDKVAIKSALTGVFVKDIPLTRAYNTIGNYYRQKAYDLFGSSVLAPTKKGNNPLIMTSDLRDKISYRTSFTYKIQ